MIGLPVNPSFMPTINVPIESYPEFNDQDIGDKVNGLMSYEVIGKDEGGTHIKIKTINLAQKQRKI